MTNPIEMSYTSASANYNSDIQNVFNDTKGCYKKADNPIETSLINICEMYKNDFGNEGKCLNIDDAGYYNSYNTFDNAKKAQEDVSSIKNAIKTTKSIFTEFKNLISK